MSRAEQVDNITHSFLNFCPIARTGVLQSATSHIPPGRSIQEIIQVLDLNPRKCRRNVVLADGGYFLVNSNCLSTNTARH